MAKRRATKKRSKERPAALLRDEQSHDVGTSRHSRWVATSAFAALIVLAGLAAYWSSFDGKFLFDDARHIARNESIRAPHSLWQIITAGRRPIVHLSLAFNYALGGAREWGYHAFNLGVHILAALTLFGLVRRTLDLPSLRKRFASTGMWLAWSVAILWVVHPLTTQSVTYVIQRGESLMGLFYLLTLYCCLRGASAMHPARWYLAAIMVCCLGMGSKAVMVTAPIAVVLFDRTFLFASFKEAWRRRAGLYATLAATWVILVAVGVIQGVLSPTARQGATVGFAFKDVTPLAYAMSQPGVILQYLRLALWPNALCLDYGWPVATGALAIGGPAVVIALLLLGSSKMLWRRSWIGFVGTFFFLVLAPTSSIVPIRDLIFEHRMYLPLAAVMAIVVCGGFGLISRMTSTWPSRRRGLICVSLVAIASIALGCATYRRNFAYHSELAMWQDVVSKRPSNARGYIGLGKALHDLDRLDEAIEWLTQAVRINPDYRDSHYNLGNVLYEVGRVDEAVEAYEAALKLQPDSATTMVSLAIALKRAGKLEEATAHLRRAVAIRPGAADAHHHLGAALMDEGDATGAIASYRRSIQLWKGDAEVHYKLGLALRASGDVDGSTQAYRQALTVDPDHVSANVNLGAALASQGSFDEALACYNAALRANPQHVGAWYNSGNTLRRKGNTNEAIERFRGVLRIDPDHIKALGNLGLLLIEVDRIDEAIEHLEHGLELSPGEMIFQRALDRAQAARRGG